MTHFTEYLALWLINGEYWPILVMSAPRPSGYVEARVIGEFAMVPVHLKELVGVE
jgi:hypothetical protein